MFPARFPQGHLFTELRRNRGSPKRCLKLRILGPECAAEDQYLSKTTWKESQIGMTAWGQVSRPNFRALAIASVRLLT